MRSVAEQEYGGPVEARWLKAGSSSECANCYAETLSLRRKWSVKPWTEANAEENVKLRPERIRDILRLKPDGKNLPNGGPDDLPSKRTKIFVGSMFDIGHRLVPDWLLQDLWKAMLQRPDLIFQLLTKRPERFLNWPGPWPGHIWLGATSGHPITKWRIEILRRSPAKVRFVSVEPLLASMNHPKRLNLAGIDWAIVGGESGAGFRGMQMPWAREVRDVCIEHGTALFMKQDSAFFTETRPYLVEADGRAMKYEQFPGELTPPVEVQPTNPKQHFQIYGKPSAGTPTLF